MRTTIRTDDELLRKLKDQARKEDTSLNRLLDRTLRAGMRASLKPSSPKHRHRERTHTMGSPRIKLDKALTIAAVLENEEIVRNVLGRKRHR
ncbi:MAG: hypothetical protein P0111_11235 [Nitrospira sp.]|nr:hypothetical protein [Nitrospira sp.]